MSILFTIDGAQTAIPDVYSTFTVANSLPAPAPAARSVLIIGESDQGLPGSMLDLRKNFFTDFQSVRDYYTSGPIVDAARMLFSNQPSPVFGAAVNRLYVYKTNNTTRASKTVVSPANYGAIVAAVFGESGNTINSQIVEGQAETLPTQTFSFLPGPNARTYKVVVDGVLTAGLTVAANGTAAALVSALSTVTGLSATGGTARTTVDTGPMTANVTASGDTLTISQAVSGSTFDSSIQPGDTCYIASGSAAAGGSNQNAGAYLVVSVTSTTLILTQLKSNEANAQALVPLSSISLAATDLKINAPVAVTVTAATATGAGASLEILETAANPDALGSLVRNQDLLPMLTSQTAAVATLTATVPATGQLQISMTGGSFAQTPAVGDVVRITRLSALAGATEKNVGLLVVTAANSQNLTLAHLYSGMTTEAVAATAANGSTTILQNAPSFVSNSDGARNMVSAAEYEVSVIASDDSGDSVPQTLIGGNVVLELGYYNAAATACTVTIDSNRVMTITPTGSGLTAITLRTAKYTSMQALVNYLNSIPGVSAALSDNRYKSLPTSVLDMVTAVGCLDGQAQPAYNGRLKKDYYDWTQYFVNNFSLLAFQPGTIVLQAGLPAPEATSGYLSGAAVGSSANSDFQNGLDAGLQVDVRIVVPLVSRDAQYDISDNLTDPNSSYTIASVNAAVKAHASTASSTLFKKERFGYVSFDGAYSDSLAAVSELAYERTKMGFQRCLATAADGTSQEFLPWMEMCAIAAGRCQAALGTSMLRKPFLLNSADHFGNVSLYTTQLNQDFSPDDRGQLDEAIQAGLVVMRAVTGFGIRMESPDLTTRSRNNDPQAWVYERENVLFTCDEVINTMRTVLENFIGNRTTDTPLAVVKTALEAVIATYVQSGALLSGQVTKLVSLGNQYVLEVKITPVEALEAITLNTIAERSTT